MRAALWILLNVIIKKKKCFTDYACGIRLPDSSKLAINWKNNNKLRICWNYVIGKFFKLPCFSGQLSLVNLFLISAFLVNNWPEMQKSEIPLYEFCQISGDWSKLWITHFAQMFLMKCYWMMQNAALIISELLR